MNVRVVQELRQKLKKRVGLHELGAGLNKQKVIQRAVFDELCAVLDPGVAAWQPRKSRANVVMFVGLQGAGKTTTCVKVGPSPMRAAG